MDENSSLGGKYFNAKRVFNAYQMNRNHQELQEKKHHRRGRNLWRVWCMWRTLMEKNLGLNPLSACCLQKKEEESPPIFKVQKIFILFSILYWLMLLLANKIWEKVSLLFSIGCQSFSCHDIDSKTTACLSHSQE